MDSTSEDKIRRTLYFSGRVQGVGFRYTTARIAAYHEVTGWVRNLTDSRVAMVVEGIVNEIDNFLADISKQMQGHIHNISSTDQQATGEFTEFNIMY